MGRIYETYVKRALDVALSGCALAVLSPVMGVTALLVRQKLGSPGIFHQDRPGKDEQIFRLYKFRTMTDARGADGELLPDAQRLTPFGRRLRSTSLDELPELWNILRGCETHKERGKTHNFGRYFASSGKFAEKMFKRRSKIREV